MVCWSTKTGGALRPRQIYKYIKIIYLEKTSLQAHLDVVLLCASMQNHRDREKAAHNVLERTRPEVCAHPVLVQLCRFTLSLAQQLTLSALIIICDSHHSHQVALVDSGVHHVICNVVWFSMYIRSTDSLSLICYISACTTLIHRETVCMPHWGQWSRK